MRKKLWMCLALFLIVPGLLFTVSCTKDKAPMEETTTPPADTTQQDKDDAEKLRLEKERIEAERLQKAKADAIRAAQLAEEQAKAAAMQAAYDQFTNTDIYFEFDSAVLTPDAQAILGDKAAYLSANASMMVEIEGHCDERGTNEYNLALGEKRALAAQAFLVNLGIDVSRLQAVTYGEERPIAAGSDESSWSKNRRAHFVGK